MFRLLLFFPLFVLANETYLLPDQATHFINTLDHRLKQAKNEVYIFTPFLDEYSLVKRLKKIARKGVKITIITSKTDNIDDKTKHLSLFKNISVLTLEAVLNSEVKERFGLKGSLVCIDDRESFVSTDTLATQSLQSNYSFAFQETGLCEGMFETIIKRANVY